MRPRGSNLSTSIGFLAVMIVVTCLALTSVGFAQVPEITCPEPIELTLESIGSNSAYMPITGYDAVDDGSGTWTNDTLYFTTTVPVPGTITVIASNSEGADTCEVAYSFPSVTVKSGTIDEETWTAVNSPYCIVDSIFVADLVIEAGVKVIFYKNVPFEITGRFLAEGTQHDSIYFDRAPGLSGWHGLEFNFTLLDSRLSYCNIFQATDHGISIDNSVVEIEHCTIKGNYLEGKYLAGAGIYTNSDIVLKNCLIIDNWISNTGERGTTDSYGGGIYAASGVNLKLIGCSVYNNYVAGWNNNYGQRVRSDGGGIYAGGTLEMYNCNVANNYVYGSVCAANNNNGSAVYARGGGVHIAGSNSVIKNCLFHKNSATASVCGYQSQIYRGGGGLYIESANSTLIENNTFSYNTYDGIWMNSGCGDIVNCILWENTNTQIRGVCAPQYSCVQNGDTLNNNIIDNPVFYLEDSLVLTSISPCIDAGHPNANHNDYEDPNNSGDPLRPARGTLRNDMGAYGGPGLIGWFGLPIIYPIGTIDTALCKVGDEICVGLNIENYESVEAGDASWSGNTLCFTPETSGRYTFTVTAINDVGSVSTDVTINVILDIPMSVTPSELLFNTTDTATVLPDPKNIYISSTCGDSVLDWSVIVPPSAPWLGVNKATGSNPDTVQVSIIDDGLVPGVYTARLVFVDNNGLNPPHYVDVTLFVESGVEVGDDVVHLGESIRLPINLFSENSLDGFTIPLKIPEGLKLDSIVVDPTITDPDSLIYNTDSSVIVYRPIQLPPMPDSVYKLGDLYLSPLTAAIPGTYYVDTTTVDIGGTVYSYQFVEMGGTPTVPYFDKGIVTIVGDRKLIISNATIAQLDTGAVAVTVQNISNLGGGTLEISFNTSILRLPEIKVESKYIAPTTNQIGNILRIVWADPHHAVNIPDGDTLFTINFIGIGSVGESSALIWGSNNLLGYSQGQPILDVEYVNGSATIGIAPDKFIGGQVRYYFDESVMSGIPIQLTGDATGNDNTDGESAYLFGPVNTGSYSVTPNYNNNSAGLDILDVIHMMWYLVGERDFSPYQVRAIDANGDCVTSVSDVVHFIRDIAGLQPIPSGNWSFVNASYDIDLNNWCSALDAIAVEITDQSSLTNDFYGIRMGDVNGDYSTGPVLAKLSSGRTDEVEIAVSDLIDDNGIISAPVTLATGTTLAGIELHLKYDPTQVEFVGLGAEPITGLVLNDDGRMIHIVRADIDNMIDPTDEIVLATLKFKAHDASVNRIDLELERGLAAGADGSGYAITLTDKLTSGNVIPDRFSLNQNYPNPFNPVTRIDYSIPVGGQVKIEVFNIMGQRVTTLQDGHLEAGYHSVIWDGQDNYGSKVASGIYFYRIATDQFSDTKKMILLK